MSSAARATYSDATSRSSSRIVSRNPVYCSVISAIGMSVIETSLTRMRCRSRSSGPENAAMATGGSAPGTVSSAIIPSWLRREADRRPHLLHRLLGHDARLRVAGVEDVAHDIGPGRQQRGALLPERLERRVEVPDEMLLAVDAASRCGAALLVDDADLSLGREELVEREQVAVLGVA